MEIPLDPKARAAATYNSAADYYDEASNTFWDRFGLRTVERLGLRPGSSILDVCCGSGASAIPAAEIAGQQGFVLGIDLAERLIELARLKAGARGLQNVEFRVGDMEQVREANLNYIAQSGIRSVEANVVYAVAQKTSR